MQYALNYGDLGRAKYEQWAGDTRKASELNGDERKEKALYVKLSRENDAAIAAGTLPVISGGSTPAAAAPAVAASDNTDYGELGKERYDFWMADTRRASELSGDERKEKALAMKIQRQRGE